MRHQFTLFTYGALALLVTCALPLSTYLYLFKPLCVSTITDVDTCICTNRSTLITSSSLRDSMLSVNLPTSTDQSDSDFALWRPKQIALTNTYRLIQFINQKHSLTWSSYCDLWKWSVTNIGQFWSTVWDVSNIIGEKGSHIINENAKPAENPSWFDDAKINWAENMLQCRSTEKVALIEVGK